MADDDLLTDDDFMTFYEPRDPAIPYKRTCPFDPAPEYQRLRAEQPLSPIEFDVAPGDKHGWLATRYEDVRAVMGDERFSHRNELLALVHTPPFPLPGFDPAPTQPGNFVRMDAPEHTRYRRLLTGFFTVRKIREYEPLLEQTIDGVLDELATLPRPVDLVEAFGRKIPARTTCSIMGLDPADLAELDRHFDVIMRIDYTRQQFIEHNGALDATIWRIIRERFDGPPTDDLFGRLIATGELTEDELFNMAWIVIGGALDTTPNMLALGSWLLMEHPEQKALLMEHPERMPDAVEEMLRYLTISHFGASRAALEDVEVNGTLIRKGQTVVLSLPAANRDPEQFERPEEFDITRTSRRHVAFGYGIHQCLGQHLARATLKIAYRKLFERFPTLRVTVPMDQVPLREKAMHYGVFSLPVTWDD